MTKFHSWGWAHPCLGCRGLRDLIAGPGPAHPEDSPPPFPPERTGGEGGAYIYRKCRTGYPWFHLELPKRIGFRGTGFSNPPSLTPSHDCEAAITWSHQQARPPSVHRRMWTRFSLLRREPSHTARTHAHMPPAYTSPKEIPEKCVRRFAGRVSPCFEVADSIFSLGFTHLRGFIGNQPRTVLKYIQGGVGQTTRHLYVP